MNRAINGILLALSLLLCSCSKEGKIEAPPAIEQPTRIPNKKALFVGNNNYPNAPLAGCHNDVIDMASYLIGNYEFQQNEVLILTDAPTEAILRGLAWLVEGTKPGDVRFFQFSGHGVEYAGVDVGSQPYGINQVICPIDFDWTPEHMILDTQMVKIFDKMSNGVKFNWVSDSCHSGDLTRSIRPGVKSKTYPLVPRTVLTQLTKARNKTKAMVGKELDVGFVSGCKYNQTSADTYDSQGRPRGALTWYLLDELKLDNTRPLNVVVSKVKDNLLRDGYSQEPQSEGARKNKPFLK